MASPRLETFCCPNRDKSTQFVLNFQPRFFSAICIGSASVSLIFAILQILPKRRGYRRLGQYPLPKPASSSRILLIISLCDILGCAVLIVNPILFGRTGTAVTSLLKGRQGIYTENERRLGTEIKIRFFKIMIVFLICWLPNIINESLLFYLEMQDDIKGSPLKNVRNAILITWFIMGIFNPMQGFLNTLAFHGWTGWDIDLNMKSRREIPWDSGSTSAAAADVYNPTVSSSLNYQGFVQDAKNSMNGNGQQHSDAISVLSEGSESSTIEIHISSELHDLEGIDADGESVEN
ncbi:G-protein coupled receptor 143 [Acipenser ruthenus]|uniref:G-protein coupled receptor 143 n=1 Tax=Acipenser ruthenus TaxID=7906 RepID=A0A444UC02_ACIRT|nr:G-protein coupled receptor 143 [Acipenser ruthenus]